MLPTWQHGRSSWLRSRPAAWTLTVSLAAGISGLLWLALLSLYPPRPAFPDGGDGLGSATAAPSPGTAGPPAPPVRLCGNEAVTRGAPSSPPKGAVVIPAGNDSGTVLAHNWTMKPHTTYWFAAGTHTLGTGQFSQIIPADDDTFIGAPGAVLDGQRENLYAFTTPARDVKIRYLTIQHFGAPGENNGQGVVNNGQGPGWQIDHVIVRDNAGAGVMLGARNVLTQSCLEDNGEYGFIGAGPDIRVDHNEIAGNNTDNWEVRRPGCGCSGGAKFWDVDRAIVTSNYIHGNLGPGLWADTDNRGFEVEYNYFAGNQGEGFIYEISYNLMLAHNTFVRNALTAGPRLAGFPDPAVYISESGADSRVPGPYGSTLTITANTFIDNWGGVVLWENADRYCGSEVNTSTGYCTLVNPSEATVGHCGTPSMIRIQPYYSDCRWKTQNVVVSRNDFIFDPTRMGPSCLPVKYCGFNGVFSQLGSWPPYRGTAVADHITFDQNNHFLSNTYVGPWQFVVHEQGNVVSWAQWRAYPYRQDAGSSLNWSGN